MEKKPFIGQFSGFLYIGEEKAEFDGEKLVSYYAKPYCSNSAKVENCIEFRENKLTIRDVHSPDSEQHDCIWEQEDIESLLDRLGMVSAYRIERICCKSLKQLVIPSSCMGIAAAAFDDCPKLSKLLCLGNDLPVLNDRSISVLNAYDCAYDEYVDFDSKKYEDNCVMVKTIPTFSKKTFVASGIGNEVEVGAFLKEKGAFLRKSISGKTDYLIVSPKLAGESKYNAVLEQAAKGHTVEVIFYDDFIKYMDENTDEEDTPDDSEEKLLQAVTNKNMHSVIDEDAYDDCDDDNDTEHLYTGFEDEDEEDDWASRMVNRKLAELRDLTIKQTGDKLRFDDAFTLQLNEHTDFLEKTDEYKASLMLFCDGEKENIRFNLNSFGAVYHGAVKEALAQCVANSEHAASVLLYESDDAEIGLVTMLQDDEDGEEDETLFNPCVIIRVGTYSVLLVALYGRGADGIRTQFRNDIAAICRLFSDFEILYKGYTLHISITDEQIEELADQLLGAESEEDTDSVQSDALAAVLEQVRTLTASAEDELQKMQNALEVQKQMLEAEEESIDYTANLSDAEIRSLMYLTFLLEYENGCKRTIKAFYEVYKDDFSSLSEQDMKLMYNEIGRDVYAGKRNIQHENIFRALPFDVRFYYAVKNAFNTADIRQHKCCKDFAHLFGKQWFSSDEMSKFNDELDKFADEKREITDSQFAAIDDSWRNFETARSSLVISLYDKDFAGYDPYNSFMLDCDTYIAVVELKSGGVLGLSAVLIQSNVDYWNTDYKTIWDAAFENEPYNHRRDEGKNIIRLRAKYAHNKALSKDDDKDKSPETTVATANTVVSTDNSQKEAAEATSNTGKKKEGCYIATAVYGSYDAPQVRILRKYRDEVLQNSIFGRAFIKVYYKFSPPIANKLKNARKLNELVRKALDRWILRLNRKQG